MNACSIHAHVLLLVPPLTHLFRLLFSPATHPLSPADFWNHSSTTVVHGQTFLEWFRDSYVFDYQGASG